MSAIDTGGPAFPVFVADRGDGFSFYESGMTLRDYLAAKAMQAYLGAFLAKAVKDTISEEVGDDFLAKCSYATADAMLRARSA